ncbi:leucine-rich repeat protein, induced by the SPI-2, partial [Escherichia coli M605]
MGITMNIFDNSRVYTVNNTTIPEIRGNGNIAQNYEAVWSAWKRAAPPEEVSDRTRVIWQLRDIRDGKTSALELYNLNISSLPDCLPDGLHTLKITETPLTALPALPDGLAFLEITGTSLTELPALPDGLESLEISGTPLT